MSPVLLVPVIVALAMIVALVFVLKRTLFVATPNEVLVLSGARRRMGGRVLGYRTMRGGRAMRVPLIERVDTFCLRALPIRLDSFELLTRGGMRLRITLTAIARPAGDDPLLSRALECLLGRSREQIAALAEQVLTGVLVAAAAGSLPSDVALDPQAFEQMLTLEVEEALRPLGLQLDGPRIEEISDEYGYVDALRRSRA